MAETAGRDANDVGQYHAASDQVDEAKRVLNDLQQRVMLGIGGACQISRRAVDASRPQA
jgi:hypothetical protein